jgi:large subunit ribosomal protein L22
MTGAKTNERPGTRARARHVRGSASKARRVLDMIRNKSVEEARSLLQFSEVGVAETVSKVLESAVANASHNDGISDDELYVAACYADEGATLKRFKPRARGRASRINKRTSHITIIVARYATDDLQDRRERQAQRGGTSAAQAEARRRRVSRSRAAETADDSGETETLQETTSAAMANPTDQAGAEGASISEPTVTAEEEE